MGCFFSKSLNIIVIIYICGSTFVVVVFLKWKKAKYIRGCSGMPLLLALSLSFFFFFGGGSRLVVWLANFSVGTRYIHDDNALRDNEITLNAKP